MNGLKLKNVLKNLTVYLKDTENVLILGNIWSMVVHNCQSKKKINKQMKKKNNLQKSKIKNVYWPITAKMTTSTQFPIDNFLTPYRYNKIPDGHLTSNWPKIFTRCFKEVKVSSTGSFVIIALSTRLLRHQIREKMLQNAKQKTGLVMDMWRRCENRSKFFSRVTRAWIVFHCNINDNKRSLISSKYKKI